MWEEALREEFRDTENQNEDATVGQGGGNRHWELGKRPVQRIQDLVGWRRKIKTRSQKRKPLSSVFSMSIAG